MNDLMSVHWYLTWKVSSRKFESSAIGEKKTMLMHACIVMDVLPLRPLRLTKNREHHQECRCIKCYLQERGSL